MQVFVGQTRSRKLIAQLNGYGWGEMTTREEFPPRRKPWVLDNGAFGDWRDGKPFNLKTYTRTLERMDNASLYLEWLVVPDRVAEGEESLRQSLQWVPRLRGLAPLYLAVQDGMRLEVIRNAIEPFAGIFIGGTLEWKWASLAQWRKLASETGRKLHVGRVGSRQWVWRARRGGVDSIDSCQPLWSQRNLELFRRAIGGPLQLELGSVA